MLLGMCDLCERSALRVESVDAEPARHIRRTVALLRIDLHEPLQEHAESLAAAELGMVHSPSADSGYYEFLRVAVRCRVNNGDALGATKLLLSGIRWALDAGVHPNALAGLWRDAAEIDALQLPQAAELRGLAMRFTILAKVDDKANFEAMWEQDCRDAMRHLAHMLFKK